MNYSARQNQECRSTSRAFLLLLVCFPLLVGALIVWAKLTDPSPPAHPSHAYPTFPLPEELPIPAIRGFKKSHPRLPVPDTKDIMRLQDENPKFLSAKKKAAEKKNGRIEAIVFAAYLNPGSVNIDHLFQRLMALRFDWRGHQQVEPLAVAYDWLYYQWTADQRTQLQEKLLEGCNYIIDFIRRERLSPYNVYLYNRPLPALIAGAIALFKDHPAADSVMAFTHDLWSNRVFPVWRQIMGNNGGWHEMGGYLAISLGQVIYSVPAMWRSATGEDLFKKEAWLRGFLDFLVYRNRPDGTVFRWADSAFFDREIEERVALSLEYRHSAAYSLRRPRTKPVPTSWPWGPLTDDTLYDPQAVTSFPFAKYFDGIGMIIANSNWSPDATYLTFKAGDNFWSHSHLDQGAFTIFKGGPLAIDSGIYPQYGSDHHMNYYYQAIAHNVITVTDPRDNLPLHGTDDRPPRQIANDGGQRRVGSGWGEPAPIDMNEWKAKYEIYHTGSIKSVLNRNDILATIADVTPAYTNSLSGTGSFHERTYRVKNFRRFFGYDRINDIVVIFDTVTAVNEKFPKRWLLHTIEKPRKTQNGFTVSIAPDENKGHKGGTLEAHVLLPEKHRLEFIGGQGREFFVDGKNYHQGGKIYQMVKSRRNQPEPGAWRVELRPAKASEEDQFLVVMSPALLSDRKEVQIKKLTIGGRIGCEISGPDRITRWLLDPDLKSAVIEISNNGTQRTLQMSAD